MYTMQRIRLHPVGHTRERLVFYALVQTVAPAWPFSDATFFTSLCQLASPAWVVCCFDIYPHASLIRTREGTNGPPINNFDSHWYSEYDYHAQTLASKSLLPTVCPGQYVAVKMRGVDRQSASNEKQIDDCREPHSPDLVFVSCWPPYIPL